MYLNTSKVYSPIFYATAKAAAIANNLSTTAMDYRLKSEGKKVFRDGKTYTRVHTRSAILEMK